MSNAIENEVIAAARDFIEASECYYDAGIERGRFHAKQSGPVTDWLYHERECSTLRASVADAEMRLHKAVERMREVER